MVQLDLSKYTSRLFVFCYLIGNKPPGLVPNKFMYMTKDLERLGKYFSVPLAFPADPFEAMFEKGRFHLMCLYLIDPMGTPFSQ